MDQRIVEIVMYVIGELQSRRIGLDEIDVVSDDLLQRGFSKREVATAFSVFTSGMAFGLEPVTVLEPSRPLSYRVLHEIERQYVSTDSHGYLIQLQHLGVLSHGDMEELLERCMMMSSLSAEEDEVRMLVATYLCERNSIHTDSPVAPMASRPSPDLIH